MDETKEKKEKKEKKYVIDNAQLMAEWAWEKNKELNLEPHYLTYASNKRPWWKCKEGHEWQDTLNHRTQRGNGCPYCSNHRVYTGFNDLMTTDPQIANEWNFEKNVTLNPSDVTRGSSQKMWWKCREGHEWQETINNRTKGSGCPYCSGKRAIPYVNDLQTTNPELAAEWYYEKNGNLKPSEFLPNSDKKVWWRCKQGHEWQATISSRNSRNTGCPYCSRTLPIVGLTDLQTCNPRLADEWNYEKNGQITPKSFLPGSEKKVWWKCKKGHEWQATINSRVSGRGCPVCSSGLRTSFPEYALFYYLTKCGLDVVQSYTEFGYELDIYIPSLKIAIEYDGYFWHKNKIEQDLEKNKKCNRDGIKLYRIREGLPTLNDTSMDYVIEVRGGDFSNVIDEIIGEITNVKVDIDIKRDYVDIENLREQMEKNGSLLVTNPKLAGEWNYERNRKLMPEHVFSNSNKRVWWKCKEGHEWQAQINSRNNGRGCPYCSNHKVMIGFNDLETTNPQLASEWDFEKNAPLTPQDISCGSNKKVWWKCKEGHEWQVQISQRQQGSGCPYCAGQRAIAGKNDLQTLNPSFFTEWNYEKNISVDPQKIMPNSHKKVWWKCNEGHEWQATLHNRSNGRGCPYCSRKKVLCGENDLQTVMPILAEEWNYEKNKNLKPSDFLPQSNKKVWWKCSQGHEWEARIQGRYKGHNCPYCTGWLGNEVINIDTGEVFESFSKAAKKYNTYIASISRCCKGNQKTAGGYHWKYYAEDDKK